MAEWGQLFLQAAGLRWDRTGCSLEGSKVLIAFVLDFP